MESIKKYWKQVGRVAIAQLNFGRIKDATGKRGSARNALCTTCPPKSRKLLMLLENIVFFENMVLNKHVGRKTNEF